MPTYNVGEVCTEPQMSFELSPVTCNLSNFKALCNYAIVVGQLGPVKFKNLTRSGKL